MAEDYKTSGEGGFVDTSPSRDNLLVVSVVVACAALFTATVAMGFSARAVSTSKAKLHAAQTSLADASASRPVASPAAVSVTERDFAVAPSAVAATAGLVDFTVSNSGPSEHEFLIFKTALAPDKLPLGSDGRVNEAADGAVKVFDSGSNIAVNGSKTFHATVTTGHYVLVCNLPGHYAAGMHTSFTVT